MAEIRRRSIINVWQDVIFAIFLREIRSQFSDKFGVSWGILNPVIFIFVLSFFRSQVSGEYTHTIPTFIFMMYGMLIIQLFLTTFGASSNAIKKNKALFAFRQVQPIAAVLANGFFELIMKTAVIFVLMLIVYFMKIETELADPLTILLCIFLTWLFAVSLGLLFAVAKSFIEEVEKIRVLLQRPLFFISAVFFSLKDIPEDYWVYLNWNPILHAIELSRDSAHPSFQAVGVSTEYLSVSVLITVFFAMACYRITWKKIISR
ncbi:ABC transporter permease [Thalassomonas sp. M1454]|uniref:ABC transporter permease n=1 Tax=Thalassomonas sp. M1454 TaxID=2594477 RepID=UPI00117DA51F|nr:ABC transporter permease [Thalassomonas sp. M1454]TRX57413.1 ABC transporter [Thalassomonas sp. M1454]